MSPSQAVSRYSSKRPSSQSMPMGDAKKFGVVDTFDRSVRKNAADS